MANQSADLFVGGVTSPNGHNLYTIAGELMSITPFRFDHVQGFFAIREWSGPVELIIAEDNEATIKILLKGRSTKMRYVHRTHRVNLDWLYEVFTTRILVADYGMYRLSIR